MIREFTFDDFDYSKEDAKHIVEALGKEEQLPILPCCTPVRFLLFGRDPHPVLLLRCVCVCVCVSQQCPNRDSATLICTRLQGRETFPPCRCCCSLTR